MTPGYPGSWWWRRQMQLYEALTHPPLPPSSAGRAGLLIDGVVYPLAGEPKPANTKSWGIVPGDLDVGPGQRF